MRTFLSKNKMPVCKWGNLPPFTYFFGDVPEGYKLCINPHNPYCIIDIDYQKESNKNGFEHIPAHLKTELNEHFNYDTPSGGRHIWIKYSGDKVLKNATSKYFIDLRTEKGYVCWYHNKNIKECLHLIKESSKELDIWLEELFSNKILENE